MNKEAIVSSAFCVHRSKLSCLLAAALLAAFFSILRKSPRVPGVQAIEVLSAEMFFHNLSSRRIVLLLDPIEQFH